ncbi:MAG: hypothetical protein E7561_03985 [Ruminococcaceae bacterium]|nr:hypothetical protein [Oscillospiraceae bacterium]
MKKTNFLRRLSAITMSVVMLLTMFSGAIVASATTETTPTNILEDEKAYASFARAPLAQRLLDGDAQSGNIADAHFELANAAPTESLFQDYAQKPAASSVGFIEKHSHKTETEDATYVRIYNDGMYDEDAMRDLVDENTDSIYRFYTNDSPNYRTAFVFRLGDYYNVDTFKLTQCINDSCSCNRAIQKFTVYAGNELNGSIWQNPVGTGGSNTEDEMVVTLNGANAVKYLVVVLDVVMPPSMNTIWAEDGYNNSYIKGFAAYGEKAQAPVENILANENAVVGEYRIELADPIINGDSLETVIGKLNYDNLSSYSGSIKYVSGFNGTEEGRSIYETKSLADVNLDKATAFDMLEDTTNLRPFRFEIGYTTGVGFKYRYAIGYDLGDEYDLDTFTLTQNLNNVDPDDRMINRFSVYAGDALNATIFNNCVGIGGSSIDKDMVVDLEGAKNVRYLLVVLDQMTNSVDGTTNMYSYFANITGLAAYGKLAPDEVNILNDDNVYANLASVPMATPLVQGAEYTEKSEYLYLNEARHNKHAINDIAQFYTLDDGDYNDDGITEQLITTDQFKDSTKTSYMSKNEVLKTLASEGNEKYFQVRLELNGNSAIKQNSNRIAFVYRLGGYYDLTKFSITQEFSPLTNANRAIYNYSVYAGNTLDSSILDEENCVGEGVGDGRDETIVARLENATAVKYVVVVLDHVAQVGNDNVEMYANNPTIKGIAAYGKKVAAPEENVLANANATVKTYTVDIDTDIYTGATYDSFKDLLVYKNLTEKNIDFSICDTKDTDDDNIFSEKTYYTSAYDRNVAFDNLESLTNTNTYEIYLNATKDDNGVYRHNKRTAIVYDLGTEYDLDRFVLSQFPGFDRRTVYNYSVYAGNVLNDSIFENCVGTGGSNIAEADMTTNLTGAVAVRYLVIVLDHVAEYDPNQKDSDGLSTGLIAELPVNVYAYDPHITGIAAYGSLTPPPASILTHSGVSADTYRLPIDTLVANSYAMYAVPEKLTYTTLEPSTAISVTMVDSNDLDGDGSVIDTLALDNSLVNLTKDDVYKNIADTDKSDSYEFYLNATKNAETNLFEFSYRSAIGYRLDGNYDIEQIVLTQDVSASGDRRRVNRFSVYGGQKFDDTIFENCLGTGGSLTAETMTLDVEATNIRCLLIVFDDVCLAADGATRSVYAYNPRIKGIEAYGTASAPIERPTYSDMTGDKEVNVLDFIALMKDIDNPTIDTFTADLNGNGVVGSEDLVIIRKLLLGVSMYNKDFENEFFTIRNGFTNAYKKIKAGKDIRIGFLGGSITYGIGIQAPDGLEKSFRVLTETWLENTYDIGVTGINAANPSAASATGAYGIDKDIMSKDPDIVFIEYAMNDKYARSKYTNEDISIQMETIVKKIKKANPNCDIAFLYTTDAGCSVDTPLCEWAAVHEEVAENYGIPTINIGYALLKNKNLTAGLNSPDWYTYFNDICHTNTNGNKAYADTIINALNATFKSNEAKVQDEVITDAPQMNDKLLMNTTYLHADSFELDDDSTGFTYYEGNWVLYDSYYYTTSPESVFSYTFNGHTFGVLGFVDVAFEYSLDGGDWVKCAALNSHPQPVVKGLEDTTHNIKIKFTGLQEGKDLKIAAVLINSDQEKNYDTDNVTLRNGLTNTYNKLMTEQKLTVAYIGGSITAGSAASNPSATAWRPLTTSWLRKEFPNAEITEVNTAIGSVGTLLPVFYADDYVLPKSPDLVFIETAINDKLLRTQYGEDVSTHYETLIRKILESNPNCDIVSVYTTNDTVLASDDYYFDESIAQNEIATYYGIPSANVGRKLRIDKGLAEPKNADGTYTEDWQTYYADSVHPTDVGHKEYANTVTYLLRSAFDIARTNGDASAAKVLPTAKNSNLLMDTTFTTTKDFDLSASTGWEYGTKVNNTSLKLDNYITTSDINNELVITFTGTNLYMYSSFVPYDETDYLYQISIDGGEFKAMGSGGQNPRCLASGLANTTHTIRIKAGGVGTNATDSRCVNFDIYALMSINE